MKCVYKYKGKSFSTPNELLNSEEYIKGNSVLPKLSIESEADHIKKILPEGIGVKLVDDYVRLLNGGEKAIGLFQNGLIELSRKYAENGTGYHEAFHAVFRTMLDDNQRDALTKQAKDMFVMDNDMVETLMDVHEVDKDVATELYYEEMLSDEFAVFMMDPEGYFAREEAPNAIVDLFQRMLSWIKNVFSNEITTKKLFTDIERGKYANKSVELKRATAYRLAKNDDFTPSQVREITKQLTFFAMNGVQDINDVDKIDVGKIRGGLKYYYNQAKAAGDSELVLRFAKVANDLPNFEKRVENYITETYDLKYTQARNKKEEEDEDGEGNTIITNHWEVNGKINATSTIKFIVSLTPDVQEMKGGEAVYNTDTYLKLPKFKNYGNTWNVLEKSLQGITQIEKDGKIQDGFQLMMDKIKSDSRYRPELSHVYNKLAATKSIVQTQFFAAFSRSRATYLDFMIEGEPDGNMTVKIGDADTMDKKRIVADEWADNFAKKVRTFDENNNEVYDEVKLEGIRAINNTYTEAFNTDRINKDENATESKKVLKSLLKSFGVEMQSKSLDKMINNIALEKGDKMPVLKSVTQIRNSISTAITSKASAFPTLGGKKIEDGTNFILTESIFKEDLASAQAYFSVVPGESMVLGPEGNKIYVNQANNSMTKKVAAWKQGDTSFLERLEKTSYAGNSLWVKHLLKSDNNIKAFGINLYGNSKKLGESDKGDKFSNLKDPDKVSYVMNSTLKGKMMGLAEADKSQQYYFTGVPLIDSGFDLKDGNIKKKVDAPQSVEVLMGYLQDELTRREAVKAQTKEGGLKPEDQTMYYHYKDVPGDGKGNGLRMYLFPNLDLAKAGMPKNEKEIVKFIEDLKSNEYVVDHVTEALKTAIDKDVKIAVDNGVISLKDGVYTNRAIDKNIAAQSKYNSIVGAIADFTINSIVANVEQTKVFNGDPALYKFKGNGFGDFMKRVPAAIASGTDFRIFGDKVRTHYASSTVANVDGVKSGYFMNDDNIKHITEITVPKDVKTGTWEKEVRNLFAPYMNVNQTDAQAWITLDAYKERLNGLGQWTEEHDKAYYMVSDGQLTPGAQEDPNGNITLNAIKLLAQPLKTVHAETKIENGIMVMHYNKQSEAVLIPGLIAGTGLAKLEAAMKRDKVDHVIVLDGKKAGASGVTKIHDDNNNILNTDEIKLNPVKLSYNGLYLQQDLKAKGTKLNQVPTQAAKNVLAALKMDEKYFKGTKTGQEVFDMYHDVISRLSDIEAKQIRKDVGYDETVGRITDTKKFYKYLSNEFKGDVPQNILDALEQEIELDALPQLGTKIQNKLNASLTKKTVKLKQLGGSVIQLSNFGMLGMEVNLNSKVLNNVAWFKDPKEQLQPMRLEEGKVKPAQVLMPHTKMVSILAEAGIDYKNMTHNKLKQLINSDTLKGLSYRIPNQGLSSNDSFEIVGILPPEMGDTMIAYTELTSKNGSDFDIDKAYITLPNLYYHKEEKKVKKVKSSMKGKENMQNLRLDLMREMFENPKSFVDVMAPLDDPWLENLISGNKDEGIDGLFPADESVTDLNFFTGTEQLNIKNTFDNAKSLVGAIANFMTHHSLSLHEDLRFKNYYLGLGNIDQETGESLISSEKDENGYAISSTLGALMNAIVDAAKDPYISRANINQVTASTAFTLARAGVDREFIIAFMGQPILKDYVKALNVAEGRISEDKFVNGKLIKPLDQLFIDYKFDGGKNDLGKLRSSGRERISLSKDDLVRQIKNPSNEMQLKILGQFFIWQNSAKAMTDVINATKADVNGATKNLNSARSANNLIDKIVVDDQISGFDEMIGYEVNDFGEVVFNGKKMIGTYHENSVNLAAELYSQFFMSETPAFINLLNSIAADSGKTFLLNNRNDNEFADNISREIMAYLVSSSGVSVSSPEELKELLYGDENKGTKSIQSRVKAARASDEVGSNMFLQALDVKDGSYGNPASITMVGKSLDKEDKDDLYLAWEELLDYDKKLGEDLIKYSYHESGFRQNMGSFYEHIPTSWMLANGYSEFIKAKKNTLQDVTALHGAADYIYKNGYRDNTLVPVASSKKISEAFIIKDNNKIKIPKSEAFVVDSSLGEGYIIGQNAFGEDEFRRYLKVKNDDNNISLFKLNGYQAGEEGSRVAVYIKTNTLGIKGGKNAKMREYNSNSNTSVFAQNNVTLLDNTLELAGSLSTYPLPIEGKYSNEEAKKKTVSDEDVDANRRKCGQ